MCVDFIHTLTVVVFAEEYITVWRDCRAFAKALDCHCGRWRLQHLGLRGPTTSYVFHV